MIRIAVPDTSCHFVEVELDQGASYFVAYDMAKSKHTNPFYILLVVAGAAFAVTAFAYGVMTVRELQASRLAGYDLPEPKEGQPTLIRLAPENDKFSQIVSRYGSQLMIGELVLLTIGTVGAIGYDQRLDRRELEQQQEEPNENESTTEEGKS